MVAQRIKWRMKNLDGNAWKGAPSAAPYFAKGGASTKDGRGVRGRRVDGGRITTARLASMVRDANKVAPPVTDGARQNPDTSSRSTATTVTPRQLALKAVERRVDDVLSSRENT